MPLSIPTLGYASRSDAVEALLASGHALPDIARQLGIPLDNARALRRARLKPAPAKTTRAPRASEQARRTVVLERDTLLRLMPHAIKRNISVNELVRRLVDTIADDKLVDGVLDDREGQS